jgi:hypothetical protein
MITAQLHAQRARRPTPVATRTGDANSLSVVKQGVIMKLDAHLLLTGRRISMLALAALVSCFMLVGTSEAVAQATTSKSLTQAQKLSKALKACKTQPKRKRAACVKRAKKKYATAPAKPRTVTPPTGPVTPPTAPVTAPAGPVSPSAPTFAEIERLVCFFHCPILKLTILERGVPRLGSGVSRQRGGDDVPSDTWIFPLLLSYDKTAQLFRHISCPLPSESCYPAGYNETYTMTYHWREKTNAQLAASGTWSLSVQAFTETCEPVLANCGVSMGGGA